MVDSPGESPVDSLKTAAGASGGMAKGARFINDLLPSRIP